MVAEHHLALVQAEARCVRSLSRAIVAATRVDIERAARQASARCTRLFQPSATRLAGDAAAGFAVRHVPVHNERTAGEGRQG